MASDTRRQVRVRPAEAADVDAIARIFFAAFAADPLNLIMYPGGPTEDAVAKFAGSIFDVPVEGREVPVVVAELVGEGDGEGEGQDGAEVVAFGKYVVFSQTRPEEEWNKPLVFTAENLGEGADLDVFNGFIGGLHRMRTAAVRGDAHVYLHILAADPARQRLGAGSAILRWGAALADAAGLPLWLEASAVGYPLYLRHGYRPLDVLDYSLVAYDMAEDNWGVECVPGVAASKEKGFYRTVLVKREPQGGN